MCNLNTRERLYKLGEVKGGSLGDSEEAENNFSNCPVCEKGLWIVSTIWLTVNKKSLEHCIIKNLSLPTIWRNLKIGYYYYYYL